MTHEEKKDYSEYIANKIVEKLPNDDFEYDYLVQNIIIAIEKSLIESL